MEAQSYLSDNICNELINIMAKSVIKIIVKGSARIWKFFNISWLDPWYYTLRPIMHNFECVLSSGSVKRFITSVPIKRHTGLGIAETIFTFLQKNSIDVKYCRSQSTTMPATCRSNKGVQQRIKDVCSYAEFCPCFAHSLKLVGSCAVEADAAASNFFSMIQQLYKFFNSSTYLWKKLEDMLKSTATKYKLLVVKRLSGTRWSARYDTVRAIALGYNEYIDLLKGILTMRGTTMKCRMRQRGLSKGWASWRSAFSWQCGLLF